MVRTDRSGVKSTIMAHAAATKSNGEQYKTKWSLKTIATKMEADAKWHNLGWLDKLRDHQLPTTKQELDDANGPWANMVPIPYRAYWAGG